MTTRALALLPLAVPLFAAPRPAPAREIRPTDDILSRDDILFRPQEGLTLTKTFRSSSERENSITNDRGSQSRSTESSHTLVVTDTVKKVADDRVLVLERVFDEIGAKTESAFDTGNGMQDSSSSATSPLDAETVVFEWDESEEAYVATSDDVDEDLLEGLEYDYDFAALLPEGAVAEDDEWEIDPEVFEHLMSPWSGLSLEWEAATGRGGLYRDDSADAGEDAPTIEESEDGEVTATYAGTRDVDGLELAVIEIAGEVESERVLDHAQSYESGSSTVHQETSQTRVIEGEVLWDVAGGHLHSIELELQVSGTQMLESSFIMGDREFESSADTDISGTSTFSVLFEAAE